MFAYNFQSAFRFIKRNLVFSFINIAGLSLGLALVILLFIWVRYELSFDRFHKNADRIFRVTAEFDHETYVDNFSCTPAPLGPALKNDIPEIEDFVRFGGLGRVLVKSNNSQFLEDIELSDPSVFKIFSFKLLSGNPDLALINPNSIVVSEKIARKYFGNENPLGQTLYLFEEKVPHVITGIMQDIPANSQLQFDLICSYAKLRNNLSWGNWNYATYILTREKKSFRSVSAELENVIRKNSTDNSTHLHIQPLTDIHLHSQLREDLPTNRNIYVIYIICSTIALILLVACINYVNLATARFSVRGKEACIRKVTGAASQSLAVQFLLESFVMTLCSFIIAVFICSLLLPVFTDLTGIQLYSGSLFRADSILLFILLIILISLLSGIYPAFMLSSVKPVSALHSDFRIGRGISVKGFRKWLIIFQFIVSIVLISCTLIIRSQMSYLKDKDLGLVADQVIIIPMTLSELIPKAELYKKEILVNPNILSASEAGYFPGLEGYRQNVWWEGLQPDDENNVITWIPADHDFLRTLRIELVKGEDFPDRIIASEPLYILNESAAKMIGWDNPLGKKFEVIGLDKGRGEVVGVVRNFNFKSLHTEVEPVAIVAYPDLFDHILVKIRTENITGTLNFLQGKWKSLFPQIPFGYSFLSDDFQRLYENEMRSLRIVTCISIISLFITCIGLFGFVLFTINRKRKEIGLRKVAGSSSTGILLRLNLEFIRWIAIAFLISCPAVIWLMHRWLMNFAYHVGISWWILALSGIITMVVSLLTVSWLTSYTASRNPVDCLRHE